ncbi:transposase [Candidatus Bipolaricaulota bacterium]|nr:transposase [Candidatus Bipolaricaulota bacterium]
MPKKYSPSLKFQVVWEIVSEDKTAAQVARAYDVHPNTVRNWVNKFKENGSEVFAKNGEVKQLEERIRELERLVGQKEREIAVLKNFIGNKD